MNDMLKVALTPRQRELLLRGLRFVRSSQMLEVNDPTPELVEERQNQLREVASLAEQLQNARTSSGAAKL